MCTSIALHLDRFYFGRNLDLEYDFGDGVVLMPRSYPLKLREGRIVARHFAAFGMGIIKDGFPLLAEGANEAGVCIAGLNFRGNARYTSFKAEGRLNLAPFELIPFLLAKCPTAEDAMEQFSKINLVDVHFDDRTPNTPLHFHLADRERSYALEFTKEGAFAYEDPYGVLTNNPPFSYHRQNAEMYMHLSNLQPKEEGLFTGGVGGIGLPGDYTSPSRFIKAAWLVKMQDGCKDLSYCDVLSTLNAVAPPRRAVITEDGKEHYTRYSCCIDTEELVYYCKRHTSADTVKIKIRRELFDTDRVILLD